MSQNLECSKRMQIILYFQRIRTFNNINEFLKLKILIMIVRIKHLRSQTALKQIIEHQMVLKQNINRQMALKQVL